MKNTVLIVVGAGMGLLLTCAVCSQVALKAERSAKLDASASAQTPAPSKTLIPDPTPTGCRRSKSISWAQIRAAMESNEAAVVKAWKDACADVTGVVVGVDATIGDRTVVRIGTGAELEFHYLRCFPKEGRSTDSLRKGQKIEVWGRGGGELAGSLTLKECDW